MSSPTEDEPNDHVFSFLSRLGLDYAIDSFKDAGITTVAQVSKLTLDDFDDIGIVDIADRRKLWFLIQRIKMAYQGANDFCEGRAESPSKTQDQVASPPSKQFDSPEQGDSEDGASMATPGQESTISRSPMKQGQESSQPQRITVVVRKRPLTRVEGGQSDIVECLENAGKVLVHEPRTRVDLTKEVVEHRFQFDASFGDSSDNVSVYSSTVRRLIGPTFHGGRATVFAFGQTGSGKTHTLMGPQGGLAQPHDQERGVYALAARDIFEELKRERRGHPDGELAVFISLFEIYRGKLFDLFNGRKVVRCLEDHKSQVCVVGLQEEMVSSEEAMLELVQEGHANRSVGATGANETSSRSHAVLQITIRKKPHVRESCPRGGARRNSVTSGASEAALQGWKFVGKISFIDLAGSERGADTAAKDRETRREGAAINTSLLALKEVIRALDRGSAHKPFRGSKLTQVLKDSFVGKECRTVMIACVAPTIKDTIHSLNTLRYADRVKEYDAIGEETPRDSFSENVPPTPNREHLYSEAKPSPGSTADPTPARTGMVLRSSAVKKTGQQGVVRESAMPPPPPAAAAAAALLAEEECEGGGGPSLTPTPWAHVNDVGEDDEPATPKGVAEQSEEAIARCLADVYSPASDLDLMEEEGTAADDEEGVFHSDEEDINYVRAAHAQSQLSSSSCTTVDRHGESWSDVIGAAGERLVHAHRRATHKSLELLKIGMELNNNAEEKRTMDSRFAYIEDMDETLEQEREVLEYLKRELSEFRAARLHQ